MMCPLCHKKLVRIPQKETNILKCPNCEFIVYFRGIRDFSTPGTDIH